MREIGIAFMIVCIFSACGNSKKVIVDPVFADSLIAHYTPSELSKISDSNLLFWKKRMETQPDNFVNAPEYASALASQFRLHGNIYDLLKADSLFLSSNMSNKETEPGIFRTLASLAITQHRFQQADSFLNRAIKIEGLSLANAYLSYDVSFELGQYAKAKNLLPALKKGNSYGYLFRRSKFEHYDGSLDSAIACMKQAADKAGTNKYLKQAALSNAADLNIHKGNLKEAYDLYVESIKTDAAEFHSIMGLGWIALVHDNNISLAEKIFQFVRKNSAAPDILLKLEQAAEARGDKAMQKKYAEEFIANTGDSLYGHMYNKYLIDLYTGILDQPAKAITLAEKEINSRGTPQTFAWYAWSLFCNNEPAKAYKIFKGHVSERPLEGPELYYMGKLMKGLNKQYNAQQFFEAAYKNKFDLSPAKQKDLEKNLE